MNEFIKKLIERLEEEKVHYGTLVVVGEDDLVLNYNLGKMHSYENAIEIINQLAEEYNNESVKGDLISRSALIEEIWKRSKDATSEWETAGILNLIHTQTVYNDEWIPCEMDLPKIPNSYLVTKMCENDGNPIYDTAHEIFWTSDRKWDCERDEDCEWKVIAWQNKHAPYQQKGE